jgi:phosphoserine phosphatase RsbU/P
MVPSPSSYESHFEHSALFEFSTVINSSLDLPFILSHVLLTIMGKLMSSRAAAVLRHEDGTFHCEMVKGVPEHTGKCSLVIKTLPQGLQYTDRLDAARHPWSKFFRENKLEILLPLRSGSGPIGILAFGRQGGPTPLKARETTYLRSLANIAATAIEKCHIIGELKVVNRRLDRKIQELNTLFDLGREFGAVLEEDKLVRLLVFSLMGQVGVHRYLVCLKDDGDMRIAASRVDGPLPQPELLFLLTKVKTPVSIADMIVSGAIDPRPVLTGLGLHAIIPMQLQGKPRGVIVLGEKLNREAFSEADFEFLAALASLAIFGLENARLFKEAIEKQKMEDELLIARDIQKGLLPSILPSIPGIDIAAANFSSKQVGGDYYDVVRVDDHRFILAIGDVSGKGTPAALLMANIQATIRALVPLQLPLSELTARVNNLMCQNTGGDKFVTFFWGMLDHTNQTLRYVNAGHNHPYLVHEDGSYDRLEKGGMILGVMETMIPYEEGEVRLQAGDLLVLFTDGVSEAMNPASQEYGEERLEAIITCSGNRTAQALIEDIHRDIQAHAAGAPQSDDITMMVFRFLASSPEVR